MKERDFEKMKREGCVTVYNRGNVVHIQHNAPASVGLTTFGQSVLKNKKVLAK